jgi:hypothetical protein
MYLYYTTKANYIAIIYALEIRFFENIVSHSHVAQA